MWGIRSPLTGEYPAQMASNAENVSIWWRHHGCLRFSVFTIFTAVGPRGIRVNAVNPATVKTEMFDKPDGPGGTDAKKKAVRITFFDTFITMTS